MSKIRKHLPAFPRQQESKARPQATFNQLTAKCLFVIMSLTRSREVSDSRDQMFALYGVFETFWPSIRQSLQVDYTRSAAQIYTDFASLTLSKLSILPEATARSSHITPGLPSWVPDYATPLVFGFHLPSGWNASSGVELAHGAVMKYDESVIRVEGARWGFVEEIELSEEDVGVRIDRMSSPKRGYETLADYSTSEPLFEPLLGIKTAAWSKNIVVICPIEAKLSDEIWILSDLRAPFILRPIEHKVAQTDLENDHASDTYPRYEIIGECFVYFYMNGEMAASGDLEVMRIEIE